jgi:hypothetical protein
MDEEEEAEADAAVMVLIRDFLQGHFTVLSVL